MTNKRICGQMFHQHFAQDLFIKPLENHELSLGIVLQCAMRAHAPSHWLHCPSMILVCHHFSRLCKGNTPAEESFYVHTHNLCYFCTVGYFIWEIYFVSESWIIMIQHQVVTFHFDRIPKRSYSVLIIFHFDRIPFWAYPKMGTFHIVTSQKGYIS